ncbi:MAG: TIGR00730 family Rossman fold protein [Gammaproteobacteria bacterium]|nr:TIGR00730 family Rossman fold protein [Gammaproteobacteria bacterium]MCP5201384.1 TIGR00730 family Rossman fold protein [Gammaproteobacteria bacterium]
MDDFAPRSSAICVFCGAREGDDEAYREAADTFGREIAARDITLVYGGGNIGLMGVLADAALDAGGRVVGVIPDFLVLREVVHPGLTETVVVEDLFERKALMIERADAFVALPGGIGTYDEVLEVIAWRQLRQLRQPIGLLDVGGYFQPWLRLLEHTVERGFASAGDIDHLLVETDPVLLVDRLHEALLA